MNLWIIWPVGIALWLSIGWAAFAYFEYMGIKHSGTAGYITLSYFVYRITTAWLPSLFLLGALVGGFWGGLIVHFAWHWCPAGSVSTGMLSPPDLLAFLKG